ncbi:unnamed protein product [Symbiodinium pilosum]|uniref:Carrier domain-containing protein n=1 Tax=Symbiodinium pilosum TaxID=2952 RepID=A0A812KW11_SYMPI|nr:unnamed protein product [Symbiodinium pilosum]
MAASLAATLRARGNKEDEQLEGRTHGHEEDLLTILREVMGRAPISPQHSLDSLGLTSLSAVRVASSALARGIQVSIRQMLSPGASVAGLVQDSVHLAQPKTDSAQPAINEILALLLGSDRISWKPLAQSPSMDKTLEVLLCPGDGGAGIHGYRPLAQSLLEEAPIAAVKAADGLLGEAHQAESLDDLANLLLRLGLCAQWIAL